MRARAIHREHLARGLAVAAVARHDHAATQGVRIAGAVHALDLAAKGEVLLERLLRDAVEQQFAKRIGRVTQAGIAREQRCLQRDGASIVQQAGEAEGGALVLPLIEGVAEEIADAADSIALAGRQAAGIGNLEALVGIAAHERHAIILVQRVVDIDEALILVGLIMQRGAATIDRLDPDIAVLVAAGDEIIGFARGAAIIEARLDRVVGATIKRHFAAIFEAILGGDVDNARRAQPILRGQCAGAQIEPFDQPRAQRLPEYGDAFGQDRAVDAILQVVMVVAHVKLAAAILHHARQLQQDLVELLIVPAGQSADRFAGDGVGRRTEAGLDRRARGIQPPRHDDIRSAVGLVGRGTRRIRRRRRSGYRIGISGGGHEKQQSGAGQQGGSKHAGDGLSENDAAVR
ncbi:hypothetical protein D9M73_101350 [compost metagenome]